MMLCTRTCFDMKFKICVTSVLILLLIYTSAALAQPFDKKMFTYLSPSPDSRFNQNKTNIIIRFADKELFGNPINESFVLVKGNKSGEHEGRLILSDDNETFIFNPANEFLPGEIVSVTIYNPESKAVLFEYKFEIQKTDLNKNRKFNIKDYIQTQSYDGLNKQHKLYDSTVSEIPGLPVNFLPRDFAEIKFYKSTQPSPGVFSFAPFRLNDFSPAYIVLADEYGIPLFYRKTPSTVLDFKKQRTGTYTYFVTSTTQYYVLDENLNIIDSLHMQNGYSTDLHELELLKNGHSLMMSYDYQPYPLDTVFANGRADAVVIGLIIQELDQNKNVVFQWRSWDHYKLTDVVDAYNTSDSVVDYVHGNAIEVDYDGNILLSSRHMDEVTKIDRQTGEIIWRLGGIHCKNNQFNFTNDPIGFSHQHDIRRLPNGHITLFDNGNLHNPSFSRGVEYEIDEVNKTATLVWEYRNEPELFAAFMGSVRRLNNRNTVIGWGGLMSSPAITEVNPDGKVIMQLSLPDSVINYRAFKFDWNSPLLKANTDSLLYKYSSVGDSSSFAIQVTNNSEKEIEINGFFTRDSAFTLSTELPVVLKAAETKEFEIKFTPYEIKNYNEVLYLRSDSDSEGIAISVPARVDFDSLSTDVDNTAGKLNYTLAQNYPNPFNPSTTISYSIAQKGIVRLDIYDVLGSHVRTLINQEIDKGNYSINFNAEGLSSGIYFYTLRTNDYLETRKMLLLR